MIVSLHALQTARALSGTNLSDIGGFKNLVSRILGQQVFSKGNTWLNLSPETQEDITELLSFFVYTFSPKTNKKVHEDFSSLCQKKYEELFKKFKKKFHNVNIQKR